MIKKSLKEHGLPLASASAVAVFVMSMPSDAQAGFGDDLQVDLFHSVTTQDPFVQDGRTHYNYTVNNDSTVAYIGFGQGNASSEPFIVDFEIPFNMNGQFQVEVDGDGRIISDNVVAPQTLFGTPWDVFLQDIGVPDPEHGWGGIADWLTPNTLLNDYLLDAKDGLEPGLPPADAQAILDATKVIHWVIQPSFFDATNCAPFIGPPGIGGVAGQGVPLCEWGYFDAENFVNAIPYGGSLGGFGLRDSNQLSPIDSPDQASWALFPVRAGDPPAPGSGLVISQALTQPATGVPEPESLALVATGLIGGAMVARARRRRKQETEPS